MKKLMEANLRGAQLMRDVSSHPLRATPYDVEDPSPLALVADNLPNPVISSVQAQGPGSLSLGGRSDALARARPHSLMNEDLPVDEDPKCAECRLVRIPNSEALFDASLNLQAIEEGSVVAFGSHIWHVECFRCAKCGTLVDHDSNLLLLSNGKPICENCSYNCRVCEKKIDDLAIMTGDDSYHSECFRCRLCQRKIEDLVFAKTSQGIYCIACHNGRMSRNRKPKSSSRSTAALSRDLKDKGLPSVPSSQRLDSAAQESLDMSSSATLSGQSTTEPDTPGHLVPDRLPPQPPSADASTDAAAGHSNTLSTRGPTTPSFEDFDFNLSLNRSEESTGSIPISIDDSSTQQAISTSTPESTIQKPDSAKVDPRTIATNGPIHDVDGQNPPIRERRRPAELDLRLPKSPEQLFLTAKRDKVMLDDKAVVTGPATSSSSELVEVDTMSLFPRKKTERLGSPLPQGTLSPTVPPVQEVASDHVPSTSLQSLGGVPDLDNAATEGVLNTSLPTSPPGKAHKPSTPTKPAQALPAVPPRSLDRPSSGRTTSKKQIGDADTKPSKLVFNTRDAYRDKEIAVQSLLTPPKVSPVPPEIAKPEIEGPQNFTLVDSTASSDNTKTIEYPPPSLSAVRPNNIPATPVVTHKRNLSGPMSPSRASGRHLSSKSLEHYPQYDTLLGSPVTTFEKDLSKAFNLSPAPSDLYSSNTSGLERSGTISRLANKMLKHRKSVSGGALSPRPSGNGRKQSLGDASMDLTALTTELTLKNGRIAELEHSMKQITDSTAIAKQLESRKSLLASLESQLVETGAEHQSYLHHRHRASDTSVPLGEWKANIVADLDSSLKKAKNELSSEIEALIRQRNDLKLENDGLLVQKAQRIQEISILEKRHSHLASMNENMLRQIQNGMEANKETRSPNLLRPDPMSARSLANSPNLLAAETNARLATDNVSEAETAYAPSSTVTHDHQGEEEDDMFSEAADNRLYGERAAELASPKKFNLVKKTKRAFRWGRTPSSTDVSLNSHGTNLPPPDRGMSSSRSSDKLSSGKSSGGMFKRTWQSQQNLSSHLDGRSGDSVQTSPAVFGNDLTLQAEAEGRLVPNLVTACLTMIEARALEYEGLYRKSGGAGEMKSLIEAFEAANVDGESLDITRFDIPAITSVLKQYLRRLPIPLICFDAYEPFLGTAAIPDPAIRVRAMKDVLRDLPQAHYQTVRALFRHLLVVARHHEVNLMTTKNLAVVLGPSIIWDHTGEKEITDMFDKNSCIQFCIEHADSL